MPLGVPTNAWFESFRPNTDATPPLEGWTVMGWYKMASFTSEKILCGGGNPSGQVIDLAVQADATVDLRIDDGTIEQEEMAAGLLTTKYDHFALTVSGPYGTAAPFVTGYFNGLPTIRLPLSQGMPTLTRISLLGTPSWHISFNGYAAFVRAWHTSLTPAEVLRETRSRRAVRRAGLFADFALDYVDEPHFESLGWVWVDETPVLDTDGRLPVLSGPSRQSRVFSAAAPAVEYVGGQSWSSIARAGRY